MVWIHLAKDRDQRRALTINELGVFLSSYVTNSLSRKTLLYGVRETGWEGVKCVHSYGSG
jgi:hypothetical protein